MKPYRVLAFTTAILLVVLVFLHQLDLFAPHVFFSSFTLATFVLLTLGGILAADRAAQSANKFRFLQVFMGFMMAKLFLSVLLVAGYYLGVKPDNRLFVIPFVLIYLVYSGLETWYFMKRGKLRG